MVKQLVRQQSSAVQTRQQTSPADAAADADRSLAGQVRRNYLALSLLPLVICFLLVVAGAMVSRDYLTGLIERSTYALNADAARNLQALGETIIRSKARDVARQLDVYVRAHPTLGIDELRRDPQFTDLAVQTVGTNGYTAISEAADTYRILVHPNPELNGQDMRRLAERMPSWWRIVEAGIGGTEAAGYYDWVEPDGSVRQKYLVTTPLRVPVEGVTLMASATTYIDEFSAPMTAMGSGRRASLVSTAPTLPGRGSWWQQRSWRCSR